MQRISSLKIGEYVRPSCSVVELRIRHACALSPVYGNYGEAGADGEFEEEDEPF